ncbi:phage integrase SAM-like domain-containing protein [Ktedonobacter racemifer]|uniref:phage integrase SAM-like domain-containing protein n=1 Tax=Ktedonobacter racemifer TaxID=363277 RepID=UPI0002E0A5B8|nr:phage integrase SAM-like domain-containing protein [Ktedonobacter racemifer]
MPKKPVTKTTIEEAIEVYEVSNSNLSGETLIWYHNKLKVFAAWCKEQKIELEEITPKTVLTFLGYLKTRINPRTKKPITSDTLHGYIKVVKLFLGWCAEDEEYSQHVKARTVKLIARPKVEQKVIETFTEDELRALFAVAGVSRTCPSEI